MFFIRIFFSLPSTIIKTVRRNCQGQKFEPEVKALSNLIKPGFFCFDVGGAYGRYAFPLSGMVGPQGRMYSFEPGSYSYKVFSFVKAFFGLKNVVLIKKAVSDKPGLDRVMFTAEEIREAGRLIGAYPFGKKGRQFL